MFFLSDLKGRESILTNGTYYVDITWWFTADSNFRRAGKLLPAEEVIYSISPFPYYFILADHLPLLYVVIFK